MRASEVEICSDTDAESETGAAGANIATNDALSSELRTIDLNRVSVRHRASSMKSKADDEREVQDGKFPTTSKRQPVEQRKVSVNSATSYPTPSPSSSYHGDSDDAENALGQPGPGFENDGFDTVLESEGFTMIDLGTIPSARQYLSSPSDNRSVDDLQSVDQIPPQIYMPPGEIAGGSENDVASSQPSTVQAPVSEPMLDTDETELSSTVPSSPPVMEKSASLLLVPSSSSSGGMVRKVTPQTYSSPKLPSPPKQNARRMPQHNHRGSSGAVFAGIALQEVVSPSQPNISAPSQGKDVSSQALGPNRDEPLFEGFDTGTKRELRAGLRFGEELAKRQSSSPPARTSSSYSSTWSQSQTNELESDLSRKPYTASRHRPETKVWRGENLVQRTPIQSSTSAAQQGSAPENFSARTPLNPASKIGQQSILDTQARREREWQLEREAVSRQIQNASESQVIVIDSDDEDELPRTAQEESAAEAEIHPVVADLEENDDDEEDIWLQEAKNSSSPTSHPAAETLDQPSGLKEAEELQPREPVIIEVKNRQRRSLIPSPWKRGDEIDINPSMEQSTFLSTRTEEMSGLMFWKESESRIKFGDGEIQRQKLRQRNTSGTFDIDLMAGTPKKERISENESMEMTDAEHEDEGITIADEPQDENTGLSITDSVNESTPQATEGNQEVLDSSIEVGVSETMSSPFHPVRIPVNFNDSSIVTTPTPVRPQAQRPAASGSESTSTSSPPRPPTPRSALKGSRGNFDQHQRMGTDTPAVVRRVIFSERSRGVDVDGLESSFSMRSSSDDGDDAGTFAADIGVQLNRELRAAHDAEEEYVDQEEEESRGEEEATDISVEVESDRRETGHHGSLRASMDGADDASEGTPRSLTASVKGDANVKTAQGWGGWLWGSSKRQPTTSTQTAESEPIDMNARSMSTATRTTKPVTDQQRQPASHHQEWERTKSSIPSSSSRRPNHIAKSTASLPLPSYLLPPSYPSDPLRSATSSPPLTMRGKFTNTHFRTLHIIYRKSLRPKFHAPARETIRPEIVALRGMEMVIDESEHATAAHDGQGDADGFEFTFTISDAECAVLERFMQEVEFGHGWWAGRKVRGHGHREAEEDDAANTAGDVAPCWGWSAEQLATWLCRIVVGEVVREEERKAKVRAERR